ncbi:pilus assembly protein [Escherichia coli]|nr:pilus assembly protein [Escherichia coli]
MLGLLKTKAKNTAAAFAQNRDGNFIIAGACVIPLLITAMGFAINLSYLYSARSNMAMALDSALSASTRDVIVNNLSDSAAAALMNRFVKANGDGGLSEADRLVLADVKIDRVQRSLSAQLSSEVRVPFSIFGFASSYPVTVAAASSYADRPVEVAMMLDVTGSMDEKGSPKNGKAQTKLDNLKDAASLAVEELLKRNQPGQKPRVKVALVPYSQGVNAGALAEASFIEAKTTGTLNYGLTDLKNPKNATIKLVADALKPLRATTDKCTTERKTADGEIDLSDAPPETATVTRALEFEAAKQTAIKRKWPDPCPNVAVVPLSSDKKALLGAIDKFKGGGGTAGHIGIQWTRYMLSPRWGSFLVSAGQSSSAPAAYGSSATSVRKVAILLTDGEFNEQYVKGGTSADFARQHCDAMKNAANNIEVFTIGFMLNDKGKPTLQACASPDKDGVRHFYDVSTASELEAAFLAITANTEVVRLTN